MNPANHGAFLGGILSRAIIQVEAERRREPESELHRRIASAPPIRSFKDALLSEFGIIAEIKQRSPSAGLMVQKNFDGAWHAYEQSSIVRAVSVLTNLHDFGMMFEALERAKKETTKPVLRKDFIFTEYQVIQARAYGADAILLMANILSGDELSSLGRLAASLGMDILFESHTEKEIAKIPAWAGIYGINCRKLDSRSSGRYELSKFFKKWIGFKDFSVKDQSLTLVEKIPAQAVLKVAESGLTPKKIASVRDSFRYNAALIGNALLLAPDGVDKELERFENALRAVPGKAAPKEDYNLAAAR